MAFTQNDIDALNAAIATGALRVRYADGREVTYRSLEEMRQILGMMQADLAKSSGTTNPRVSVAGF